MSAYRPGSRRPIADVFRRTAHTAVLFCVRHGIHADAVSYASIVAAALAGACLWQASTVPVALLIAPVFCYIRLWLNMLDGMVALESGTASPRGEILNDLPDRVSDVLVFAGLAHSGLNSPSSGYWCAIFALLTAYVGMLGQAVGVHREFSGVMSKPWRMVAVHVGAWITWGTQALSHGTVSIFGLTVLDWTCLVIVAGCVQTIVVRLRRILSALAMSPKGGR